MEGLKFLRVRWRCFRSKTEVPLRQNAEGVARRMKVSSRRNQNFLVKNFNFLTKIFNFLSKKIFLLTKKCDFLAGERKKNPASGAGFMGEMPRHGTCQRGGESFLTGKYRP